MKRFRGDNRGEGNLLLGVGLFFCAMLFLYVFFTYQSTMALANHVRDQGRLMLDAYTIQRGRSVMSSIKNGNDYTPSVDERIFLRDFRRELGINSNFIAYQDGKLRFSLRDIHVDFVADRSLKTKVSFTMELPFYLLGRQIFVQAVPMLLQSHYYPKQDKGG